MLQGYTIQDMVAAQRQKFARLLEQYQVTIPDTLPEPNLYDLIDGVDSILFPLLIKAYGLRSRKVPAFEPHKRMMLLREEWYRGEQRVARSKLASAARVALTAWLADDPDLVTWGDNDRGPVYVAVAQLVRDLQATDPATLLNLLQECIPDWLPEHRRADWQKYTGGQAL